MTAEKDEAEFLSVLEAARAGDIAARDRLFERYYDKVERLVHAGLARDMRRGRSWLGARFSTGDVVQEVFRHLLTDFGAFSGTTEDAFIGYLAISVRHRLLDAVRFHEAAQRDGRRTTPPPEHHDPAALQHRPVSDLAAAEEVALFHEVLAGFPDRERFLLRARIEEDVRFQELAEQLGYPSHAAARRAFYAAQASLVLRLRKRTSGHD